MSDEELTQALLELGEPEQKKRKTDSPTNPEQGRLVGGTHKKCKVIWFMYQYAKIHKTINRLIPLLKNTRFVEKLVCKLCEDRIQQGDTTKLVCAFSVSEEAEDKVMYNWVLISPLLDFKENENFVQEKLKDLLSELQDATNDAKKAQFAESIDKIKDWGRVPFKLTRSFETVGKGNEWRCYYYLIQ